MAKIKHGQTSNGKRTSEYRTWSAMKDRCNNNNDKGHRMYGGRGISVCKEWHDFRNFFKDMGKRPPGMSLERINNDGNYEPDNCKWASLKEQANNKTSNRLISFYGTTKTISEWCDCLNIAYGTLHNRLILGWSIRKTLTTPTRKDRRNENGRRTLEVI